MNYPASARHATASTILAIACLTGCALLSPEWMRLAEESNLESRWIKTAYFRHLVLSNARDGAHLRIYIEGDGSPWARRSRVAVDPTPTNPVLLRLMHLADHAAVYLGRPCYFGSATDSNCDSSWWTFNRYSRQVIESMCAVANALIEERKADTVQLVGYSGGAALVIGMTTCTDRLAAITTIAGNLTPAAWTQYHGYTPLDDLTLVNFATQAPATVSEMHWQCESDQEIPTVITANYFAARPKAARTIVKECGHSSGWDHFWPRLVQFDPLGTNPT